MRGIGFCVFSVFACWLVQPMQAGMMLMVLNFLLMGTYPAIRFSLQVEHAKVLAAQYRAQYSWCADAVVFGHCELVCTLREGHIGRHICEPANMSWDYRESE